MLIALVLVGLVSFQILAPCQALSDPKIGEPPAPDIIKIMDQVYLRPKGNNIDSIVEMILIGNSGSSRIRKIKSLTREDHEKRQRLLFFIEPADVRNTAFLIDDYKDQDQKDAQWIFLPSYHKTKRIASESNGGSFMGSDFSHADLTTQVPTNFTYRFIKDSQIGTHPVWIIEATPKDGEIMRDYGYSKSLFLIRKDNYVTIRAVHWLSGKDTLKYIEVKQLDLIDHIWVPMEIHAKTVKKKKILHQTVLRINSIAFNQPFPKQLFTIQRLEQGL